MLTSHQDRCACRNPGLNQGPLDLQSNALPTELFRLVKTTPNVPPNTAVYLTEALDPAFVTGLSLTLTHFDSPLEALTYALLYPRIPLITYSISKEYWCIQTNRSSSRFICRFASYKADCIRVFVLSP